MNDDLLTVPEVSAMLRKPQGTLRYWRSVERGPVSFLIGSTVVYERVEVERYLAAQKANTSRGDVERRAS